MTTTNGKPPFPAGGSDRNCEIAPYVIDMLKWVATAFLGPVLRDETASIWMRT